MEGAIAPAKTLFNGQIYSSKAVKELNRNISSKNPILDGKKFWIKKTLDIFYLFWAQNYWNWDMFLYVFDTFGLGVFSENRNFWLILKAVLLKGFKIDNVL